MSTPIVRIRYRIEASIDSIDRLVQVLKSQKRAGGIVYLESVRADVNEEYYYVTVQAEQAVHTALKHHRFTDTRNLPFKD